MRTLNSTVYEALNSRLIGPRPTYHPAVFLLMTNDTRDRDNKQTNKTTDNLWEEKDQ